LIAFCLTVLTEVSSALHGITRPVELLVFESASRVPMLKSDILPWQDASLNHVFDEKMAQHKMTGLQNTHQNQAPFHSFNLLRRPFCK